MSNLIYLSQKMRETQSTGLGNLNMASSCIPFFDFHSNWDRRFPLDGQMSLSVYFPYSLLLDSNEYCLSQTNIFSTTRYHALPFSPLFHRQSRIRNRGLRNTSLKLYLMSVLIDIQSRFFVLTCDNYMDFLHSFKISSSTDVKGGWLGKSPYRTFFHSKHLV